MALITSRLISHLARHTIPVTRRSFFSDAKIFISRHTDPYLNLSLEHSLFQSAAPGSVTLFLYTNRPCIVIGRNQNPWLEVNLPFLRGTRLTPPWRSLADQPVLLVRRRSGGGAVFHDGGNTNWSVICPTEGFERNKHAEMVVRALRRVGVAAAVNKRHDIVVSGPTAAETFKISGSAYRLTSSRALHHGTCLLSSPHLASISKLLRSPAEPYIKALGASSVRSPIANVGTPRRAFEDAVVSEFTAMYGASEPVVFEDPRDARRPEIAEGVMELSSSKWIYEQTPRFLFSTHPTEDDPRPRPPVPFDLKLQFEAKKGVFLTFSVKDPVSEEELDAPTIVDNPVFGARNWSELLESAGIDRNRASLMESWLDDTLGRGM